jgi:hypothetical protein
MGKTVGEGIVNRMGWIGNISNEVRWFWNFSKFMIKKD